MRFLPLTLIVAVLAVPPASAAPVAVAAALAAAPSPPAPAPHSRLHLSWHAPYGQPRASETLAVKCDSSGADTLYLSFLPGRASPSFSGFSATLMFRPLGKDSLGPYWRAACGTSLPPGWKAAFDPGLGYPQPWRVQGAGGTFYDCSVDAGRLRIIWAVPADRASGIRADTVLTLGRVVLRHPPAGPLCDQPVCIEWTEAELVFEVGAWGAEKLFHEGDHRFASWSAAGTDACAPLEGRGALKPKPWSPKAGKP